MLKSWIKIAVQNSEKMLKIHLVTTFIAQNKLKITSSHAESKALSDPTSTSKSLLEALRGLKTQNTKAKRIF